jgi:hypothetical protein
LASRKKNPNRRAFDALGVTIGLLVGVGLAWLSAVRLVLAWSQMQHR